MIIMPYSKSVRRLLDQAEVQQNAEQEQEFSLQGWGYAAVNCTVCTSEHAYETKVADWATHVSQWQPQKGDCVCAGTQKATFNGTGQPANGQTTSVYTLNFAGNCTAKSNLASKLPLTAQSA